MDIKVSITDEQYEAIKQCVCCPVIDIVTNKEMYDYEVPEQWIEYNIHTLVNQCVEQIRKKKLNQLGIMTIEEIELIEKWRERGTISSDVDSVNP